MADTPQQRSVIFLWGATQKKKYKKENCWKTNIQLNDDLVFFSLYFSRVRERERWRVQNRHSFKSDLMQNYQEVLLNIENEKLRK